MTDVVEDGSGSRSGGGGGQPPPGRVVNGPFVMECEARKYAWCRCKRSASFPLCDGSHRGSDESPIKVTFDSPRTVRWCACARTGDAPFCDGSHDSA